MGVPRPERSATEIEPIERDRERRNKIDHETARVSTISCPNSINIPAFEPQGRDASIERISIEINTIDSAQKGG
jgi:hypothetical protein